MPIERRAVMVEQRCPIFHRYLFAPPGRSPAAVFVPLPQRTQAYLPER